MHGHAKLSKQNYGIRVVAWVLNVAAGSTRDRNLEQNEKTRNEINVGYQHASTASICEPTHDAD